MRISDWSSDVCSSDLVEVRLDDLQGEAGGDSGVEGVAAELQHRHTDCGGDPMRRGDDDEGAGDLRPCCESRHCSPLELLLGVCCCLKCSGFRSEVDTSEFKSQMGY